MPSQISTSPHPIRDSTAEQMDTGAMGARKSNFGLQVQVEAPISIYINISIDSLLSRFSKTREVRIRRDQSSNVNHPAAPHEVDNIILMVPISFEMFFMTLKTTEIKLGRAC